MRLEDDDDGLVYRQTDLYVIFARQQESHNKEESKGACVPYFFFTLF